MKVFFIGAGPGDVELLTLKAKKIIKKANLIIYTGSLVNPEILKFANPKAKIYNSAKMNLEEIFGVINKYKNTNYVVARIHTGDPSIYGAIQEQIVWCEKEKITYEIVPGVSSFSAAAASLKQELTMPGKSQTVILTRLSGKTKVPVSQNLKQLAKTKATLVIFLSLDKIRKVVKEIVGNYESSTPVAVVYRASWKDEKIVKGTLKDIVSKVKTAKITKQALIIVGEVLSTFNDDFVASELYNKNFSHSFRKKK